MLNNTVLILLLSILLVVADSLKDGLDRRSKLRDILIERRLRQLAKQRDIFDEGDYDGDDDDDEDEDDGENYNRDRFMSVLNSIKEDIKRSKRQPSVVLADYDDNDSENDLRTQKYNNNDDKNENKHKPKKSSPIKVLNVAYKPSVKKDLNNLEVSKQLVDDKSGNNEQEATINVDDSVEKQKEFVTKINPDDVFLEASTNKSNLTGKAPNHSAVKQPKIHVISTKPQKDTLDRTSLIAVIAGCCLGGIAGIMLAGYCWFKLRQESKFSDDNNKSSSLKEKRKGSDKKPSVNDEKLEESAQVFHYLHAKKQIQQLKEPIKSDKLSSGETSDEEDENTVYECPGLAPPGDMKVVNPLFSDADSHHSDRLSDTQSHGSTPTDTDNPDAKTSD